MKIIKAEHAGFCFGVRRAVDAAYENIGKYKQIYTYGPLIHNEAVVDRLKNAGVPYINNLDEIPDGEDTAVVIRSHGVPPDVFEKIEARGFSVIDATCPFVRRIQKKAMEADGEGRSVVIVGRADHPEVIGINGWARNHAVIITNESDVERLPHLIHPIMMAQTTITRAVWETTVKAVLKKYPDVECFMSICETTLERQLEAVDLAKKCDRIFVVGGKNSSNTQKLYQICKKYCKFVMLIEDSSQLSLEKINFDDIIGIVAGASTPDWMITEVENRMSEVDKTLAVAEEAVIDAEESVSSVEQPETLAEEKEVKDDGQKTEAAVLGDEDFLKELDKTFATIKRGQVITGTVVQVSDDDISLNIAYKSDGIIPRRELPIEPDQSPKEVYSIGDEVEAQVISMNDGEGRVKLSLKRMQDKIKWQEFLDAHEEDKAYDAKIFRAVKGGVIAKG